MSGLSFNNPFPKSPILFRKELSSCQTIGKFITFTLENKTKVQFKSKFNTQFIVTN